MRVIKVLNNSLVLALNDEGQEIILMGKGIGFQKTIGYKLSPKEIDKVFVLKDRELSRRIIRLAAETDSIYFEMAKSVIDFAGSVAFASSMGIGIVFYGLSVLAVEGVMTLLASLLTGVLTDAVIKNQEQVVTTGSTLYPRGLLLGYITNASLDETGVAKYATLEPSCDLSKLEQIAIITEYNVQ